MNLTRTPHRTVTAARLGVAVIALATLALATLALAGCSGPAGANGGPGDGGSGGGQGQGGGNGQGGGRQPGVFGKIAAVSGKTLQVQGTQGQTAVSYTSKTTFTDSVPAAAWALKVGLCANARSARTDASTPPSATDQIAAADVTLSTPTSGECQGGFGGGGRNPGGFRSGGPGNGGPGNGGPGNGGPGGGRPSGFPSGGPGRFFGGANGKVVSVSGASFVVESTRPDQNGQPTTTRITVTTTASTNWAQIRTSTAKAVKVGRCALALGKADDTGALTATSLRLSEAAKDGTCARF